MYVYFKVLNLEYVPGYGSGRSAQLYSCTNDIVWDTNTTCTNTVCIRIRVPVPIYLFAEYRYYDRVRLYLKEFVKVLVY